MPGTTSKFAFILVLLASLGCGNVLGPSSEELAKQEADRRAAEAKVAADLKSAEDAKLADQMKTLAEHVQSASKRLDDDPKFDQPDLDALRSDIDSMIALINEHPDAAKGKAIEVGGMFTEFKDFVAGIRIGTTQVDAKTGGQTGQRIEKGNLLRFDVLDGEWSAKGGSKDWPPNPGTGYSNYQPGWLTDFRVCPTVDVGAIVAKAGNTCFASGSLFKYSGAADILSFTMNDNLPDDNSGLLTVRWRIFTRNLDTSKFPKSE